LTTIRILTNNPKKLTGLEGYGLAVTEQVPIEVAPNPENERYLAAKREKLGHRLHHQDRRFEEDLSSRLDGGEQRAEVPASPAPERET
jgi:3,4-dihydroxy 2-butanone 4-phosphate synthase/GTP cyclohydrolase II